METWLPFWQQLVESFGVAGAAMVLIYGGLLALLILSILWSLGRMARSAWRRARVRRLLEEVHRAAYRERPRRVA